MFKKIIVALIRVYQFFSRRFWPNICRFYPSCSEYMILAVQKYGVIRGVYKGLGRIVRCHPGNPGGVDMP